MPVVAFTDEEYRLHLLWKDWLSDEQSAAMRDLIVALAEANGAPSERPTSEPSLSSSSRPGPTAVGEPPTATSPG